MIFYLAHPSVLQNYKLFHQPPIKRVKPNLTERTIEIWFDPQPGDDSFDFYKLEKVFPSFDMKIGDCWKIETDCVILQPGIRCFKWTVLDTNVQLQVVS